ncbi:MAG: hypothetical protein WBA74_09610 [Cyclobacteriaceae bacterium]
MAGIPAILMLCLVCYQDLKQRAINILVFPALALIFMAVRYLNGDPILSVNIILNCSYVLILVLIILLYFKVRFGSWRLLDKGLGTGDLVFWMVVCLLPDFQYFLIWFNISMLLSLAFHLTMNKKSWYGSTDKIPLAGLQAAVLIIFIIVKPMINL